mmetsp:Transcript_4805/g.18412  ORF Transcript_4805/g.18412 Transcript_4805/m.18412 type:complete len:225 (+) Transcript_4805:1431-2105(+)
MTPPTTTRAYTPKYEPRSASATGSRPNMDASSAGNAARMSTSGRAPASTFAPASPDSSYRTRVLGHRIVGSSTRTTTSPKRTSRPHHANSSKGFNAPSPASSTTRFGRNRLAKSSIVSPVRSHDDVRSYASLTDAVVFTCSVCSPGRPPTFANEHPSARVSVGAPRAPFSSVPKNASIFARSLSIAASAHVARSFPLAAHSTTKPRAPTARPRTRASSPSVMSW